MIVLGCLGRPWTFSTLSRTRRQAVTITLSAPLTTVRQRVPACSSSKYISKRETSVSAWSTSVGVALNAPGLFRPMTFGECVISVANVRAGEISVRWIRQDFLNVGP
jgi:hypothetical protein